MKPELTILIIEDEALIAENIRMKLLDFGYDIADVCYNYDAARAAIVKTNYDLVISDINLGNGIDEKSGLDLMRQMKALSDRPFIFLTAFDDTTTIKKAAPLLPSAYLVKPIHSGELYAAIQVAIEHFNNARAAIVRETRQEVPDYFFTKLGTRMLKVYWEEVYHLETIKNYVRITTADYAHGVLLRGSLQQVMQVLIPQHLRNRFVKISRSEAIAKRIFKAVHDDIVETSHGNFSATGQFRKEDFE